MNNIVKDIESIKKLAGKVNETECRIYALLEGLKTSGAWKDARYYDGADQLLKYKDGTFGTLIYDVFGRSLQWYSSMEGILNLDRGYTLIVKYGRENMVTYLNSTPDERASILRVAEKCTANRRFANIRREIYGTPARPLPEQEDVVPAAEYEKLNKKYQSALREISALRAELEILR